MSRDLTLTIGRYDRILPLETGEVTVDGVDLTIDHDRPGRLFQRVTGVDADERFELTEMSLSTLVLWTARGDCPYVGIPVFPSRYFRHGMIFVNDDAGIEEPEDLRGATVGIFTEYQMTMATTIRGILQDDYDVRPEEVTWVTAREEKIPLDLPEGVDVTVADDDLHDMLDRGDLDALFTYKPPAVLGDGVSRLFPDFKAVEKDYYERRDVFPIMHTVVLHEDLYAEAPAVATALYDAMVRAKDLVLERLYNPGTHAVSLPWLLEYVEETRETFGEDFWPYGIEANRAELEALTRFSSEQGLSDRRVDPEEPFVPELRDT